MLLWETERSYRDVASAVSLAALFAIPAAMLYVSSGGPNPYITGRTILFRVLVSLALIGAAIARRLRWHPLIAAFALFVLACGISDLFGVAPLRSLGLSNDNFRMEGFPTPLSMLIYLAALLTLPRGAWVWFIGAWAASGAVMAGSGVVHIVEMAWKGAPFSRTSGLLLNPDFFSVYLLLSLGLTLLLLQQVGKTWLRLVLIAALGLDAALIIFAESRATLVALVAGAFAFAMVMRSFRTAAAVALGVAIPLVIDTAISATPVLGRFFAHGEPRMNFWPIQLDLVLRHPVLGWGQDGAIIIYDNAYLDRAHNLVLDLLLSVGVVGLSTYFLALTVAFAGAFALRNRYERAIAVALLTAYVTVNMFTFDIVTSSALLVTFLGWLGAREVHHRRRTIEPMQMAVA